MILNWQPNPAASLGVEAQEELNRNRTGGKTMAWTTPTIVEVCVGMEVTAYSSAEI
jgi:coenzyme PQQ precursor peptide PqqA